MASTLLSLRHFSIFLIIVVAVPKSYLCPRRNRSIRRSPTSSGYFAASARSTASCSFTYATASVQGMVTFYSSPTTGVIAYQTDRSEARLIELCPLLQVPLSLKPDRLVQIVVGEHATHLPCTVYFRGDGGIGLGLPSKRGKLADFERD